MTAARKQLAVYLMAEPETPDLAAAAVDAGADIIEIGFPFSDPLADGPVLRRAAERALASGMRTRRCIECVAQIRARVDASIVPMTYSSILEAYGYDRFVADAQSAGATSVIIPDLPTDANAELRRIHLVAPTTPDDRIRLAADRTDGWLYLVSLTGTTGQRAELSPSVQPLVKRARALTEVPLLVGFGIATPQHAKEAAALADGVVVGTAAVQTAEDSGPRGLHDFVRALREGVDQAT